MSVHDTVASARRTRASATARASRQLATTVEDRYDHRCSYSTGQPPAYYLRRPAAFWLAALAPPSTTHITSPVVGGNMRRSSPASR
jgi:hypothetical protein